MPAVEGLGEPECLAKNQGHTPAFLQKGQNGSLVWDRPLESVEIRLDSSVRDSLRMKAVDLVAARFAAISDKSGTVFTIFRLLNA